MMSDAIHKERGCAHWLALLTGLLAAVELGAAVRAVQLPGDLAARIHLPMPLEFVASVAWAALSALTSIRLLKRQPNATHHAAWLFAGFILYSAARLLLFTQADYDRQRLPFLLVILLILIIPAAYAAARPTEAVDGRKPQD
jgi:hypothetical protein